MVQLLLLMLIGLCVCVALTMSPMWPACRMADNDITVPDVDGSHSETHLWRRCRVRSAQLYPQILAASSMLVIILTHAECSH